MRVSALILFLLATSAGAVPIVDQEALPNGGVLWLEDDTDTRQSFAIGISGSLTALDLYLDTGDCGGGCYVFVYDAIGSEVSSGYIDSPPTGWITVSLSVLSVISGQTFAFGILTPGNSGFGSSDYGSGLLTFECNYDGCIDPVSQVEQDPFTVGTLAVDFAFRTRIESAAPIPEPDGIALFAIAAVLALVVNRTHAS